MSRIGQHPDDPGTRVEAQGVKKGRTNLLSSKVYRRIGRAADYLRQAGFEPLQQEEMVLRYARKHGTIRRRDVMELCKLGQYQARRLLQRLVQSQKLGMRGKGKGAVYERAHKLWCNDGHDWT